MTCGHLFNGIGGFPLAASWMGWENIMHCEIDSFCNRVMNYHFPNSFQHEDIRTTDFTIWRGKIDLLTGGFPCQPYSTAGKRKGTADDRHLWPEMLRAIREISPRWIVGENVRGLTNWNGGLVFDQVQADMEAAGYEVIPFLLPAAGVGAPHRRDRIWFVAHAADNSSNNENRNEGQRSCAVPEKRFNESVITPNPGSFQRDSEWPEGQHSGTGRPALGEFNGNGCEGDAANSISIGQPGPGRTFNPGGKTENRNWKASWAYDDGRWPTESPIRGKYDGISEWVVRYINPEIYASISKKYSHKDLQEVWQIFQSEDIRKEVGRLYKIHETGLLLQTVQLCSTSNYNQERLSVFSAEASQELLRTMRKYGTLANSPQGRKLAKQFTKKFANTLPFLSHEIALVAMEAERAATGYREDWAEESLKALGNAICPQVAFEIFKAIEQYETPARSPGEEL